MCAADDGYCDPDDGGALVAVVGCAVVALAVAGVVAVVCGGGAVGGCVRSAFVAGGCGGVDAGVAG
eukprot:11568601-Alexandrium_andersonii.AAC.1